MKSIRARLFAFLLVGAIGVTCTACGRNSEESSGADNSASDSAMDSNANNVENSEGNSDSNANEETLGNEMIKQDMTISDYDVDDAESNVPVNQGVTQSSGNSEESNAEESYVVVTDDSGQTVTDDDGNVVTEVATSGDDSSASEGTYTPDIAGKLLYWLDMSQRKDYVFNGDFVDVTFRVKDDAPDGNYTIGIGECDFANYDAETVTYTSVDGDIAVGNAQKQETGTPSDDGTIKLVCESTEAEQGEEVTVRFMISDNPGVVGLIFRFTFDQNALEFVSYDVGEDCADYISLA